MTGMRAPEGVGWTALMTARARAKETLRPNPTVVDPWAGVLIAAAGGAGIDDDSSEMWNALGAYFAGRSPFYDAHVRTAVDRGARQVVLLAAGLDARAGRLRLPEGIPVFEVDTPAVLDFKAAALGEYGLDVPRRVPVPADLTGDWAGALHEAGLRADQPTAWVAEGLLMYLDAADADRLLATVVGRSAPGSGIALEYFARPPELEEIPFAGERERDQFVSTQAMFRSGPDAVPSEWFPRHGLVPDRDTDVARELRAHGSAVPAMLGGDGREDPVVIRLASGWVPR